VRLPYGGPEVNRWLLAFALVVALLWVTAVCAYDAGG